MSAARRAAPQAVAALAAVAFLAPSPARAEDDPWWGRDKGIHFGVGAALALGGWAAGIGLFDEPPPRFVLGATVSVVASIGKELHDWTGRGHPSWRDFTWGLLGTGVGLLLAWAIDALWVDEPEPEATDPPVAALRW
ncbi:MAG: hypothetical protein ACODAU_02920 [Myxococcota bacterium]